MEVIWAMQSTFFWAGLPQMMSISAPITAAAIDWDTAANGFKQGRFKTQMAWFTDYIPNTISSALAQARLIEPDEDYQTNLFSPRVLDKMLGIKFLGYTMDDNDEWMGYQERYPMALNPLNWLPFFPQLTRR